MTTLHLRTTRRSQAVTRRALLRQALTAALLATLLPAARAQHAMGAGHGAPATTPMPNAAPGNAVEIRNFAFVPARLTVVAGTRVVWTNRDDEAHLVASTSGAFKASPALDTGDSFAMVFDKPGSYDYFCSIHPMMRGTVVVR